MGRPCDDLSVSAPTGSAPCRVATVRCWPTWTVETAADAGRIAEEPIGSPRAPHLDPPPEDFKEICSFQFPGRSGQASNPMTATTRRQACQDAG